MRPTNVAFRCGDPEINACHDLAARTLAGNIHPYRAGLLAEERPVIMAGGDYPTPWTRDAAYNTWNAGAWLAPEAARATLVSVLAEDDHGIRIGGQYWDAIAWVTAALHLYKVTGDDDFLVLAHEAAANSLDYFERTEFDPGTGLFTGPASYGDGVAAYPEPYCDAGGSSGILDYPRAHPEIGRIRMKALSTNCLYHGAYRRTAAMARQLGVADRVAEWDRKAGRLRERIVDRLWIEDEDRFGYFLGNDDELIPHMEGLGQALAILLDVADPDRAARLVAAQHVTPYGIPCVWPAFPRFASADGMAFGRHNGTVWPFIQGFWAEACARAGRIDLLERELRAFTASTKTNGEFKEIVHPVTGEPYGGLQVRDGAMETWGSCRDQTWSATGYLRILYQVIVGLRPGVDELRFAPSVPPGLGEIALGGVQWRDADLEIRVRGEGARVVAACIDGRSTEPAAPADLSGPHKVELEVEP